MGENGPEKVNISTLTKGRKTIVVGLPGAFTGTCTTAHVPSFIRTKAALEEKGVEEIICVAVNDPFVMAAWSDSTGAGAAGIMMLADPAAEFTKAIGMNFNAPPVGFFDRCTRFSAYVEDGVVKVVQMEEARGVCEMTAGETMLDAI